jgi:hypothetical protein
VYYAVVLGVLVLIGLTIFSNGRVTPARAQVDVSIEPGMTKGPATAPVTIFEFSDYQ